jgi:hypothetical protein
MVMAGMFRKDDVTGGFYAIVPEFIPYNISKVRRARLQKQQQEMAVLNQKVPAKKVVIIKRRTSEQAQAAHDANTAGIGALTVNAEQPAPLQARPRPWRPEDTVDQLTLVQAKAVHAYLQQVFGAL